MSRGPGKTMRLCLNLVLESPKPVSSGVLSPVVFKDRGRNADLRCWHALRKLSRRGLIADLGRVGPRGVRLFAPVDGCKIQLDGPKIQLEPPEVPQEASKIQLPHRTDRTDGEDCPF